MRSIIVAAVVIAIASAVHAGSAQTNAAAEEEIMAVERAWMDAVVKKDRRVLEALIADDFLLLGESWAGDRDLTDKTRYIDNSLTLIEAKSFAFSKTRVQVRADVAVLHGLYTAEATVKGQNLKSSGRITDTWVKERGQWRVLSRHASALAAPQR